MRISGLVVCVDYAEHLARSLEIWRCGLDSLSVVTSPMDLATQQLCHGVCRCYTTDAFYRNGASFNKGAAISEAFDAGFLAGDDWLLLFDADVIPPPEWRRMVENATDKNTLYGAARHVRRENGMQTLPDADPAGYFMLFHSSTPEAGHRPIVDTCWPHAGNYDSTFMMRFGNRRMLPLSLEHIGNPGRNWFGMGNGHKVDAMLAERARRDGAWQHERMQ